MRSDPSASPVIGAGDQHPHYLGPYPLSLSGPTPFHILSPHLKPPTSPPCPQVALLQKPSLTRAYDLAELNRLTEQRPAGRGVQALAEGDFVASASLAGQGSGGDGGGGGHAGWASQSSQVTVQMPYPEGAGVPPPSPPPPPLLASLASASWPSSVCHDRARIALTVIKPLIRASACPLTQVGTWRGTVLQGK